MMAWHGKTGKGAVNPAGGGDALLQVSDDFFPFASSSRRFCTSRQSPEVCDAQHNARD
jgi:hypothetical protein